MSKAFWLSLLHNLVHRDKIESHVVQFEFNLLLPSMDAAVIIAAIIISSPIVVQKEYLGSFNDYVFTQSSKVSPSNGELWRP